MEDCFCCSPNANSTITEPPWGETKLIKMPVMLGGDDGTGISLGEDISTSSTADHASTTHNHDNNNSILPILIIPGFMSSGLVVEESNLRKDWIGKRIWLNLSSLGMSAIYFGKSQAKTTTTNTSNTAASKKVDKYGNEDPESQMQHIYKSSWLEHMRLSQDMQTEPKGVKIRAIQGLEGVDYLTPGMFTNMVSYVFGPVISALKKVGYTENVNLEAAPYDWRLPPIQLEKRDKYFTKTITQVEQLYKKNDKTPIVLIGHSLGTKTAHYFLNFALKKKGQKWIDTYIHTYLPVGAPHLGAPKALRSHIAGDKMSLDTFLSDEEALVLGRSFGSGPWLFPHKLPKGVPCSSYVIPHGVLQIRFEYAVNTYDLVEKRRDHSRPNRYRLVVCFGGQDRSVITPFQHVSSADRVSFTEQISFATDEKPNQPGERALQFILQEPGVAAAKHERSDKAFNPLKCICKCIAYVLCCAWICDLIYHLIRCVTCGIYQTAVLGFDAVKSTAGGGTTLAFSEPLVIPPAVWRGDNAKMEVRLFHKDDYGQKDGLWCLATLRQPRVATLRIHMRWISHNKQMNISRLSCSAISNPDPQSVPLRISKGKKQYREILGNEILEREGLNGTLKFVKDALDGDSLGPRYDSAITAPPVKRVHAIYGVNLPTEIGAVYKRTDTYLTGSELKNLYVVDKKATIDRNSGYQVKNGILMETSKTKQDVAKGKSISGDGTVPYWSLQHCKTWHSRTCEVSVVELPKAEHREILADPRFHKQLISYCRRN